MLFIKKRGKPKQGRIQRGFVKGGGAVVKWRGGGGRVIPVHFQSTAKRNFQLKLPFLVQASLNCPTAAPKRYN